MMCQSIGYPPTGIIGFGKASEYSLMRVPSPPQNNTTFIAGLPSLHENSAGECAPDDCPVKWQPSS
jgi:hypothetical protein